eukprot:gene36994-48275_t
MILFAGNDPRRFATLHTAILALFRLSTLDSWYELVYVNYFGCDQFPGVYQTFPDQCDDPRPWNGVAAFYFISFAVTSCYIMLTLFIGIITTTMEEHLTDSFMDEQIEKEVRVICEKYHINDRRLESFRKIFELLNIRGGSTIDQEEMQVGLVILGEDLTPDKRHRLMTSATSRSTSTSNCSNTETDTDGMNLPAFIELLSSNVESTKGKMKKAMRNTLLTKAFTLTALRDGVHGTKWNSSNGK